MNCSIVSTHSLTSLEKSSRYSNSLKVAENDAFMEMRKNIDSQSQSALFDFFLPVLHLNKRGKFHGWEDSGVSRSG